MERESLISELTSELEAVQPPPAPSASLAFWLVIAWAAVISLTLFWGPLRPDAIAQLLGSPRFALETGLGFAAAIGAIWGALELGLPNPHRPWRFALPFTLLAGAWTGLLIVGLWFPALEPSMLGKRPGCSFQTLGFSLLPMAVGFAFLRKRSAIHRAWAGALVGAGSAAVPALMMQFACMYLPEHDLIHHLGPALLSIAIGAALGVLLLRRI